MTIRSGLVVAACLPPALGGAGDFVPLDFEEGQSVVPPIPGYDISPHLADCAGPRDGLDAERRFACALGCSAEEPPLLEALRPWSGTPERHFNATFWQHMCDAAVGYSQAFMAKYRGGRLFWRCCSSEGACEATEMFINGVHTSDVEALLQVVLEVAQATDLPDMDFCFNTGDQPFTKRDEWAPVPQFHWVSSPTYWGIPVPSPFHLKAFFRGRLGDSSETLSQRHVPWEQRDDRLFWRGVLSGPDNIIAAGIEAMPRLQLFRLAKEHPDLFDVAFNDFDREMEVALGQKIKKSKEWKRFKQDLDISERHHKDFNAELPRRKFVINVSAVLSSWRLVELLASGALLFLQEDADKEVLKDWLVPWEHFIPVRYELSDLVPKLRWLRAHDGEARRIAEQGYARFAARARQEDVHCYVWRALRAVSRIAGPGEYSQPFQEYKLRSELRSPRRKPLLDELKQWQRGAAVEL